MIAMYTHFSAVGKWPRALTALRIRALMLSMALSTWLGLSGIGACRGSVGWVSVVWVRLRQSVR
jgi:hypothetical protein